MKVEMKAGRKVRDCQCASLDNRDNDTRDAAQNIASVNALQGQRAWV